MKSPEDRIKQRDERRASKVPKYWYLPFTWVPPKLEKKIDKKGNEHVRVKQRGYFKPTWKAGDVFESGVGEHKKEYVVQASGALKRKDINRAERRQDKNSPQKQGKV